MNGSEEAILLNAGIYDDAEPLDIEELEKQLECDLSSQQLELESLKDEFERIGTPEALGETVMNVVWEQFINQVAIVAGEDFIKENQGLTLDLRDGAHIQTTEAFAVGEIATHNTHIDYQERYDVWQGKLQHDSLGNVVTHKTRSGRNEANILSGARHIFDKDRPVGSSERRTDMDHTVSAGEIIRDAAANAHLSEQEQIAFANSDANLNEIRASHNRSKKDTPMEEWLDTPNSSGQTPKDIYADPMSQDYLSDEVEQQYRDKEAEARTEYNRVKKEGEERSIDAGRESQREEALRIGGKALRSVLMGLLASLIKEVISKLIGWLRSEKRNFSTFTASVRKALRTFFSKVKQHIIIAGDTFLTSIGTAIWGPIIRALKGAWMIFKQGYHSLKSAIDFLKDPQNKNMPFSLKIMNVGKIVISGLTTGGAIFLTQVLEKALMGFPAFAFEIPLLGSLASIIGMFLGGLISGLIGALLLNLIDRMITKKLRVLNLQSQIKLKNEIIETQDQLSIAYYRHLQQEKASDLLYVAQRHQGATKEIAIVSEKISNNQNDVEDEALKNEQIRNDIDKLLDQL